MEHVEHKFLTWHYHRLQSKNAELAVEGNEDYATVKAKIKQKRVEDKLFNDSCAFMDGQSLPCPITQSLIMTCSLQD